MRRTLNLHRLTILLATHNLDEADRLCDRLAILHRGRIGALGTPKALRTNLGQRVVEMVLTGERASLRIAIQYPLDTLMVAVRPFLFFLPFWLMSVYLLPAPGAPAIPVPGAGLWP